MKKTKTPKLFNAEKNPQIFDDEKKKILEQAEQKLLAQRSISPRIIDVKVYIKKTELVASNLSYEMGENMLEINELQKIVYNDLKKEIKKKIDTKILSKSKQILTN